MLLFDIFTKPIYLNKNNFMQVYTKLNEKKYFNIRSIKKNSNNFEHLISGFKCKLHIICLTETWLGQNDNIKDFELEGYHPPHYQNRTYNLSGGGVLTYIHKDIGYHKFVKEL